MSNLTVHVPKIAAVTHQAACGREFAVRVNGWNRMLGRQCDQPVALSQKENFSAYYECARSFRYERREGGFDLAGTTSFQNWYADDEGTRHILNGSPLSCGLRDVALVDQYGNR